MASTCIFCGGGPLTKEHGWSKWIDKFLRAPQGIRQTTIGDDFVPRSRGGRPRMSGAEVRAVCGECNNGWMSTLESAADPIIGPMMTGESVTLSREEQSIVTTWIILKSLVHMSRDNLLPELAGLCKNMFADQIPWQHYHVMIGKHKADKWTTLSHIQPLELKSLNDGDTVPTFANGHFVTLSVKHFVAQALYLPQDGLVFHIGGRWPSTRLIHPFSGEWIWPPGPALTSDEVEKLAKTDLDWASEPPPSADDPWPSP